jgi:hypothetical protein
MTIAIAIPLTLGAAGAAWAQTAYETGPIRELLPPKPSPTNEDPELPKPLQKLVTDAQAGTTNPTEGGTTDTSSGDRTASGTTARGTTASAPSGLNWTWSVPYGGWRRFLMGTDSPYGNSAVTYITSVPAQSVPTVGTTTVARVGASAPRTPVYLWVVLPLGLLTIWAAGLAVFEPIQDRGRVLLAVRSVRRTARDLPAGMTRSVGRAAVRIVRGFTWGQR